MTSRCRAYDPGEASGSSTRYLGGETPASPRVSNSTTLGWAGESSRSPPSDSQVRSRRSADELPDSANSDSQVRSRRTADELPESADSQSQRGRLPTALFADKVRARYERQCYDYENCSLIACPRLFKALVESRDCSL